MTGIVSGDSLGLSLTSLKTAGSAGQLGQAAEGNNGQQVYVNVSTGNLIIQDVDQIIDGAGGLDIPALRTYNSQGLLTDDNGDNWSNGSYANQVLVAGTLGTDGSTVVRTDSDGAQTTFIWNDTSGTYLSSGPGTISSISISSDSSTLTYTEGGTLNTETYDVATGHILTQANESGDTLSYAYNEAGQLASVTDGNGDSIQYDYDGNNISDVRAVTGTGSNAVTVSETYYQYDSSNRLTGVTVDLSPADGSISDGNVYQTNYTYDGSSDRVASITQSDGSSQSFTYTEVDGSYRVASATDGLGNVTTYDYDTADNSTTVTDPLGLATVYGYDANGDLTSITSPAVNGTSQVTSMTYDVNGNMLSLTDPDGNTTTMTYDANGNMTSKVDALGNTTTWSYDPTTLLKTSMTTYTTPAVYTDGVLTTPASGAQTTYYKYDADDRLCFVITPNLSVSGYFYDMQGNLVETVQYDGAIMNQSNYDPATTPESAMAFWGYAYAGVSGSYDFGAITTYTYNALGQATSTTTYGQPEQNQGAYAPSVTTNYTYDARGNLLSETDGDGNATSYTYDGLNRLLTKTDAAGNLTSTSYSLTGNSVAVTLANGLTTTSTYDADGNLTSTTQTNAADQGLGTTRYSYDADNRLIMTEDATGVRTFTVYDAAGRVAANIDGDGAVTEYSYNGDNQVLSTTQYTDKIDTSAFVDGEGNPIALTLADVTPTGGASSTSSSVYDAAGRLIQSINGDGYLTTYSYDGVSQLTSTTVYAMPTTIGTDGVAVIPSGDSNTSYNFYDANGNVIGVLDGTTLTQNIYDVGGQLIQTIEYATPVTADPSTTSFADLIPATSSSDICHWYWYDASNQVVGTFDSHGAFTSMTYDAAGNLTSTRELALNYLPYGAISNNVLQYQYWELNGNQSGNDRVTTYTYTDLNQVVTKTDNYGVVTSYAYDNVGNLISSTTALGAPEQTSTLSRYDAQGNLVATLSGNGAALITTGMTQAEIDAVWAEYGTSYSYDDAGRMTSMTDADGDKTLYYYDNDGNLLFTVDPTGDVTGSTYDGEGNTLTSTSYGTALSSAQLGSLSGGLVDSETAALFAGLANSAVDSTEADTYDADGNVLTDTDALGNVTTYGYGSYEELVSSSEQLNSEGLISSTSYQYNSQDELVAEQTSDTSETFAYDNFGRLIQTIDGDGVETDTAYDSDGNVVSASVGPAGDQAISRKTYDTFDRILTETDGDGYTTSYSYNNAARSVTVTMPMGETMTTVQNELGQTVSITDGKGYVTSYSYDQDGNLLSTTDPDATTSSTYDAADRLMTSTDGNGVVTSYSYDAAGRMLSSTLDPSGLDLTTSYQYDAKGQQIAVTDPMGIVTTYAFDLNGNTITKTVDATSSEPQVTTYTYDAAGDETSEMDASGSGIAYVYNGDGAVLQEADYTDGAQSSVTNYTYDAAGRKVAETSGASGEAYFYNDRGQLELEVDNAYDATQYTYDADGMVSSETVYATPDVPTDGGDGLDDYLSALQSSASDQITHYTYNYDGQLAFKVNGLDEMTTYSYDADHNLMYSYDYAGIVDISSPSDLSYWSLSHYGLNPQNSRLTIYTYDAEGRMTSQVTPMGALTTYAYDADGNQIESVAYANELNYGYVPYPWTLSELTALVTPNAALDHVTYSSYDAADRLTAQAVAQGADGDGNTLFAVTDYGYDADGDVTSTTQYATLLSNATLTSGATPAQIASWLASVPTDAAEDRTTYTVYNGQGEALYTLSPQGEVTGYVYDASGNVVKTTQYAITTDFTSPPTAAEVASAVAGGGSADRTSWSVSEGGTTYLVDATGAVTEQDNDTATGNLDQVIQYATKITVPVNTSASNAFATIAGLIQTDAVNDRVTQYVYDGANRLTYTIDAEQHVTKTTYDGVGRVLSTEAYDGFLPSGWATDNFDMDYLTTGDFDGQDGMYNGQGGEGGGGYGGGYGGYVPAQEEGLDDGSSRTDSYTYDAAGEELTHINGDGYTESWSYDNFGDKASYANNDGYTWSYSYNLDGQMTVQTDPYEFDTTFTQSTINYGTWNSPAINSFNVQAFYSYNAFGDVTQTKQGGSYDSQEQRVTNYSYNAAGEQVGVDYGDDSVYDAAADTPVVNGQSEELGAVETTMDLTTTTAYDAFGDAVVNKDVGGNYSYKAYDKDGNVVDDIDNMGGLTQYGYDAFGEATTETRYGAELSLGSQDGAPLTTAEVAAAVAQAAFIDQGSRVITTEYDADGRVTKVIQPEVYNYDVALGGAINAAEASGTAYDAFGDVVDSWTEADQGTTRIAGTGDLSQTVNFYDQLGQQTAEIDVASAGSGYVTTSGYDAFGDLTAQDQYATDVSSIAWLTGGAIDEDFDASTLSASNDDRDFTYQFDDVGNKTSETENFNLNSSDNTTVGATEQATLTTTYGYDGVGNLTSTVDSDGHSVTMDYNYLGQETAVFGMVDPVTGQQTATYYEHDEFGDVIAQYTWYNIAQFGNGDYADRATFYNYDNQGHLTATMDQNSGEIVMDSNNAYGEVAKTWEYVSGDTDADALFTVNSYDADGNLINVETPDDGGGDGVTLNTTAMSYDAYGEMTEQSIDGSVMQLNSYDGAGREWRTTTSNGSVEVNLYTVDGQNSSTILSEGFNLAGAASAQATTMLGDIVRTDSSYNMLGQVTQIDEPVRDEAQSDGSEAAEVPVINQTFDRWGNLLSTSDARNDDWITSYAYNGLNQLEETTKPDDNGDDGADASVWTNYYDVEGEKIGSVDADGNLTQYQYDVNGDMVKQIDADGGVILNSYDVFGDMTQSTDADGNVTDYTYDGDGRLTSSTIEGVDVYSPDGTYNYGDHNLTTDYYYDSLGRRTETVAINVNSYGVETSATSYDLSGAVMSTTDADGDVTHYTYDAFGHKASETDPVGPTMTWTNDQFGNVLSHVNLAGNNTTYTYNGLGEMLTLSGNGDYQEYVYDSAGQQIEINDTAIHQVTLTGYDLAGNHILEETIQNGQVAQDNMIGYDAQGRMRTVQDGRYTVDITYDKNGNRVHVAAHDATLDQSYSYYYAYDSMNRATIQNGVLLANNTIGINATQGDQLTYDDDGNQLTDTHYGLVASSTTTTISGYGTLDSNGNAIMDYDSHGNPVQTPTDESGNPLVAITQTTTAYAAVAGYTTSSYTYTTSGKLASVSKDGTLTQTDGYDWLGQAVRQVGVTAVPDASTTSYLGSESNGGGGGSSEAYAVVATAGGSSMYSTMNVNQQVQLTTYDNAGRVQTQTVTDTLDSSTGYTETYSQYDADGDVGHLTILQNGIQTDYGYAYAAEGDAEKISIIADADPSGSDETVYSYDAQGFLTSTLDTQQNANNLEFVNNVDGEVLERTYDVNNNNYLTQETDQSMIVNGQYLGGSGDSAEDSANAAAGNMPFSFTFTPESSVSTSLGAGSSAYVVNTGDTLTSIAQGAYGDSSLWIDIAQANGLTGDVTLTAGQVLQLPSQAQLNVNNAENFKPYDAAKATGAISPQLPAPQAASCGAFGEILIAAVVVAVSLVTSGVASGASGGLVAEFEAGAAAVSSGDVGAAVIGSVVGNAVGQGIEVAAGLQQGFSFDELLESAAGAAVSAEVGPVLGGVKDLSTTVAAIATAATSNAATQVVGDVLGTQKGFNWTSFAASAAGAGASSAVNQALEGSSAFMGALPNAGKFVAGAIAGTVGAVTTGVLDGGKIAIQQVATDAFGNALGDEYAPAVQGTAATGNSGTLGQQTSGGQQSNNLYDPANMDANDIRNTAGYQDQIDAANYQVDLEESGRQLDQLMYGDDEGDGSGTGGGVSAGGASSLPNLAATNSALPDDQTTANDISLDRVLVTNRKFYDATNPGATAITSTIASDGTVTSVYSNGVLIRNPDGSYQPFITEDTTALAAQSISSDQLDSVNARIDQLQSEDSPGLWHDVKSFFGGGSPLISSQGTQELQELQAIANTQTTPASSFTAPAFSAEGFYSDPTVDAWTNKVVSNVANKVINGVKTLGSDLNGLLHASPYEQVAGAVKADGIFFQHIINPILQGAEIQGYAEAYPNATPVELQAYAQPPLSPIEYSSSGEAHSGGVTTVGINVALLATGGGEAAGGVDSILATERVAAGNADVPSLFGQGFITGPVSHTPGVQNGVLGEDLGLQTIEEQTGLTANPLQNNSGNGADGVIIDHNAATIYNIEVKSSQNGVLNAATAQGDPAAKLTDWANLSLNPAGTPWASQPSGNAELAQEIIDAINNGYEIKGVQVQVGVPRPGTSGIGQVLINPWN